MFCWSIETSALQPEAARQTVYLNRRPMLVSASRQQPNFE